jgi:hypothetical protein
MSCTITITDATLSVIQISEYGPQGPQGATGEKGDPGAITTGIGEPDPAAGENGDNYLDGTTGDLYLKADDTWSIVGNLAGPQGEQGPAGEPGTVSDAYSVPWDHSPFSNVGDALDSLFYVSPSVSLSGGSTNEKGSTVANVSLSWSTNKNMTSRLLSSPVPVGDRDQGAGGSGSYVHLGANITANTTYSIQVSDGTNTTSGSTSVSFVPRRFYGAVAATTATEALVEALSSELSNSKAKSWTESVGVGAYLWYAIEHALGTPTFKDGGTGFAIDMRAVQQITVTNSFGYSATYDVYVSTNPGLGTLQVVAS